jgi:hypothetical protein
MLPVHFLEICDCQGLTHGVETGLVLLEQVVLLLHLLLLHLCLPPQGIGAVVAVVDETVVSWRFQGCGIANVGWSYSVVHLEGLRGLSLVLFECFLLYLRLHS